MTAVSDTTPLHYLVLLRHPDLLHELFERIIIPSAVAVELSRPETPELVRRWISALPSWLEVRSPSRVDPGLNLGAGEREAISFAQEINADFILLDDRRARTAAQKRGITVVGTLNILDEAAERGLVELSDAIARLRQTNFRASESLLQHIIDLDEGRRKSKSDQ